MMRHISRRCSANNCSLRQMLNRCLFSALPEASEDLLSERREQLLVHSSMSLGVEV